VTRFSLRRLAASRGIGSRLTPQSSPEAHLVSHVGTSKPFRRFCEDRQPLKTQHTSTVARITDLRRRQWEQFSNPPIALPTLDQPMLGVFCTCTKRNSDWRSNSVELHSWLELQCSTRAKSDEGLSNGRENCRAWGVLAAAFVFRGLVERLLMSAPRKC
jgi:hypothetical protein